MLQGQAIWVVATEGNQCKTDAKTQAKKKRKINSCILIPSLPSRILQQLKSLIQNASLIQAPWKNSIFPKEIHFLGNKKGEQEEQIHVVLKENKSHTSEHSTSHKEVICLHKLYLRLKTNVYSVQVFTVSCFTQNPVLATQSHHDIPAGVCEQNSLGDMDKATEDLRKEKAVWTETALHSICTSQVPTNIYQLGHVLIAQWETSTGYPKLQVAKIRHKFKCYISIKAQIINREHYR